VEDYSVSDAALAEAAQAGEIEALAGLLSRYQPSLYAAAVSLLRSREDALDAVQETFVVALVKLRSLRDPAAVGGWLHRVLRNTCLLRLRRDARAASRTLVDWSAPVPTPEEALEDLAMRDVIWTAIDTLSSDDRATLMLRYFSRCQSYEAIASITAVPIGTVRSRLHRSRAHVAAALERAVADVAVSSVDLQLTRRDEWEDFYATLHEAPVAPTYQRAQAPDVEVSDRVGRWRGIDEWSDHEREAIELGVRATIVGLVASHDLTIVEIDFANPAWANDHCPPRSTFVHHLTAERSSRLDIHYV
jgi:RNA polymerase sigma-70 factor (ECF subfamily)